MNRNGELLRFDDARAAALREGDRLVCLCNQGDGGPESLARSAEG